MVQVGAEAVVLKETFTQRLQEMVVYLGTGAATLANQVVMRVACQLKLKPAAAEVGHKHEAKLVEKLQRPVYGRLVSGGIPLLHGR